MQHETDLTKTCSVTRSMLCHDVARSILILFLQEAARRVGHLPVQLPSTAVNDVPLDGIKAALYIACASVD